MWYVMQVVSGQENRTAMLVERMVPEEILESCVLPTRRLRKKFQGAWHEVTEKLFPGYVFLITGQPQLLYEELKRIPLLTRMLGQCGEYFVPLPEADVRMMEKFLDGPGKPDDLEAEISKVAVEEGKQIKILAGPLKNLEGQIKKVNLHKRTAAVEVEFMGGKLLIYLGIEIVNEGLKE